MAIDSRHCSTAENAVLYINVKDLFEIYQTLLRCTFVQHERKFNL